MRVALCQHGCLIADLAGIATRIRSEVAAAAAAGAGLAVFPELATLGYPPRDLLDRRRLVEAQWAMVHALAAELPIPCVLGGVEPIADGGWPALANVAVAIAEGRIAGIYRKRLLPTYDVFDERRHFRPGDGPLVLELAGLRVGFTVCEDIWSEDFGGIRYGLDPVAELAGRCDLLLNLSASPYHADKPQLRRRLIAATAARVGCPVAYVNQVGGHDELLFDGDSRLVGPDGTVLAACPRWQDGTALADLAGPAMAAEAPVERWSDLHAGLTRGLADYVNKTQQRGVVLGLSGGIDSALVATLAVDALGPERVHGLFMPGPFSSTGSLEDAAALARNLGVQTWVLPIAEPNRVVQAVLEPSFAGLPANVAEENIQARLRGLLVMAHANKHGLMALTTGNKSEVAVGYCTIYGDMNGGLNPIGDLYKTEVYALSRWLNREAERIPAASIDKAPSAELRANQTDQDSLPPYVQLDRILRGYIEDGRGPAELITAADDAATVNRIVRLVELAEWKRRQAAPILRVTAKAFGLGRRIPLARAIETGAEPRPKGP